MGWIKSAVTENIALYEAKRDAFAALRDTYVDNDSQYWILADIVEKHDSILRDFDKLEKLL